MTNDVINTAEEQTEGQASADESSNNQTFDAGAATKEEVISTETADDPAVAKAEESGETALAVVR